MTSLVQDGARCLASCWLVTSPPPSWGVLICLVPSQFLLAELNTFYLKFVLWMPPEHYLVLLRLVFFVNVGGVAMREIYDFMDDPWVAAAAAQHTDTDTDREQGAVWAHRLHSTTSNKISFVNGRKWPQAFLYIFVPGQVGQVGQRTCESCLWPISAHISSPDLGWVMY